MENPGGLIVVNATVVTMDGQRRVVHDGAIAVRNGRIVDIGTVESVRSKATKYAQETRTNLPTVIDAQGGIALPGFVNLHAHLAMTLLRGYADDRNLQGFLDRVLPAEGQIVNEETVRVGAELAFAESIHSGISTTLDMYFHPGSTIEVADRVGVRVANGPVIFSGDGPDHSTFDKRMELADSQLRSARADGALCSRRWMCPHSTYTITPEHLKEVRDLAARHDASMTIHAAENRGEVEMVIAQTGRRPVELLNDLGMLTPRTVLAHVVDLSADEIKMISVGGAAAAHNPLSNMKLASGFAPVPELLASNVTMGIGTDGTASSNDLDMYLALRFVATIHKGNTLDATLLPAYQALEMATIGGARALGLEGEIGSIEIGKRADIQILAADRPNMVPSFDPVSTIVYAAGRADVRTVIVDGRIVLEDGRLTTIDLAPLLAEARRISARL